MIHYFCRKFQAMRCKIFVGFLLVGCSLQAQVYNNQNLSLGISGGLNRCNYHLADQKFRPAITPVAGLNFFSNISKSVILSYGAQFAMKGANEVDSLVNIRGNYLEAFVGLHYKASKSLRFGIGFQPGLGLLAQSVQVSGESVSGTKRSEIDPFNSPVFESYAEAFLAMSDNIFFGYKYFLPFSQSEFSRMEFRLVYLILEGYASRR